MMCDFHIRNKWELDTKNEDISELLDFKYCYNNENGFPLCNGLSVYKITHDVIENTKDINGENFVLGIRFSTNELPDVFQSNSIYNFKEHIADMSEQLNTKKFMKLRCLEVDVLDLINEFGVKGDVYLFRISDECGCCS